MRVIVTRPAAQAATWLQRLQSHGIDSVALPLIHIAGPADTNEIVRMWQRLADMRLVVFVSANAVAQFFALRPTVTPWPDETLAASTGPGTTQALLTAGLVAAQIIEPAASSDQFDSEALWLQLHLRCSHLERWNGAQVLVVRGDGGRDWLADTLREHGALVHFVAAYCRTAPTWNAAAQQVLAAALAQPDAHVWLFSSSESIDHLSAHLSTRLTQPLWAPLVLGASRALATHPRIAEAAQKAGFGVVRQCKPSLDDVVGCIQSFTP